MTESKFEPGTYVKDGVERVASRRSQAVALVFDGYVRKGEDTVETTTAVAEETPEPDAPVEVAEVDKAPKNDSPTPRTLAERSKKDQK